MRSARSLAVLALVSVALAVPPTATARAASAPAGCPPIMPTAEVRRGMVGTGLTVVQGSTPMTFSAHVLGVLDDAVAPGRDLIVVEASGAGIDEHGIWSGMSGSPVSVDGRLVGAVSYGLTWGPSGVVGLTPAEDLMDVLALRDRAGDTALPQSVDNPPEMRTQIADRHDLSVQDVPSGFSRLKTPLSVSGVSQRSIERLTEAAERTGAPLVPYLGGRAAPAAATAATSLPRPGGNLAAALSYGDVTVAAVGTATYVCGDTAVGFGHPLLFQGAASLGANDAESLGVVGDSLGGSFKLARLGEAMGVIDQDRMSGVRIRTGAVPATTPVTSTITAVDTGRSRTGRTDVVHAEQVPSLAFTHVLSNVDTVIDRIGRGSAESRWVAKGTRADGSAWRLERENRFSSPYDIAIDSSIELVAFLSAIAQNASEDMRITSVRTNGSVDDVVRRYTVADVTAAVDGGEPVRAALGVPLFATPGSVIDVTATLIPYRSTERRTVELSLTVPQDAVGDGFLSVTAGSAGFDPFVCLYDPQACGSSGGGSLDELLDVLAAAPRNDDLVAALSLYGGGGDMPGDPGAGDAAVAQDEPLPPEFLGDGVVARAVARLDQVASGSFGLPIHVAGGTGVSRLAGTDRVATAVELSRATHPAGADHVVVARADDPADSVAAAPLAASLDAPVLLASREGLSPAAAAEVTRLGATTAVLLGGTDALSSGVDDGLRAAGVVTVERVSGATRYATAAAAAARVGATEAVLVDGEATRGWADAVSAAAHAATTGKSLLLAGGGGLPPETAAALDGLTGVLAVGGPAALPAAVLDAVRARGVDVRRVAGGDRYETATMLADESTAAGADAGRIWIASGAAWPDALAAGAAAAADGGVLVLTDPVDLRTSAATEAWLRERAASGLPDMRLLGGFAAISGFVEQQIVELLFGGPPGGEPIPGEPVASPARAG